MDLQSEQPLQQICIRRDVSVCLPLSFGGFVFTVTSALWQLVLLSASLSYSILFSYFLLVYILPFALHVSLLLLFKRKGSLMKGKAQFVSFPPQRWWDESLSDHVTLPGLNPPLYSKSLEINRVSSVNEEWLSYWLNNIIQVLWGLTDIGTGPKSTVWHKRGNNWSTFHRCHWARSQGRQQIPQGHEHSWGPSLGKCPSTTREPRAKEASPDIPHPATGTEEEIPSPGAGNTRTITTSAVMLQAAVMLQCISSSFWQHTAQIPFR